MKKSLIHMFIAGLLMLVTQVAWSGQFGQQVQNPFNTRAFYGDKVLDRVVVIDVQKMQPLLEDGFSEKVEAILVDSFSFRHDLRGCACGYYLCNTYQG